MDTAAYGDWVASDYSVMTLLLYSMDENVGASVIFMKTAKELWDTLEEKNSNKKNISRVN